ncbi:hypothetical protein HN695_07555 [Candidatus Woesearchaeota archaeon]|jgi:hypothetical protein|nr:hypothetical protein [Candidatus Woesearchaeota archaeon]MBT5272646.1 hypothetical protein [Candidatus Woesearchaeota archaeon]MBT6041717.1 hypothetical protein [Candidatus Woesearchaeota archaeon]MBT6337198.1 hypothetical protein [Candidatus Woesearchaeota archaeon]MBT7928164.1 hypothetical protein [Candidatus Woesearchaeota archaeon]
MLKESLYMLKRRIKGAKAIKAYDGNPEDICYQIIQDCYNERYFQVSAGHFNNFYVRDFGMCVKALLKLELKEVVHITLTYAMSAFEEEGKITTTITDDETKDFFDISPDSLAFLLYSLRVAKEFALVEAYKKLLNKEINRYYNEIVEKSGKFKGLVKEGYFGSMKDHAIRNSSCYDNCMLAMISNEADKLKLDNPFKKHNYKKLIKKHFWNGQHFKDDLNNDIATGDANVFPYWCEVFELKKSESKKMLKSSIKAIQKNKLDKPFPLKYSNKKAKDYGNFLFWPSLFAPNYEGNAIWMHLGLCYLDIIAKIDKKLLKKYLKSYTKLIKDYKNFLEVYDCDGKPYKSLFYLSDESMIWCCKYLELNER